MRAGVPVVEEARECIAEAAEIDAAEDRRMAAAKAAGTWVPPPEPPPPPPEAETEQVRWSLKPRKEEEEEDCGIPPLTDAEAKELYDNIRWI